MGTLQPCKVISMISTPDSSPRSCPPLGPGKSERSILVLGKVSSGKSTLINTMFPEKVAKKSSAATPTGNNRVEVYETTDKDGVPVSIYDTSGLLDLHVSEDEIWSDIREECPDGFNLVLICIKMTDGVDRSMIDCLQKIGDYFSKDMWDRSLFVLTFANFFLLQEDVYVMTPEKKRNAIVEKIREVCKEIKGSRIVPGSVFSNIPFVIAGCYREKYLVDAINWLDDLKEACRNQCKDEKKKLPEFLLSPKMRNMVFNLACEFTFAYIGGSIGKYVGGAIGETVGKNVVNYYGFKVVNECALRLKGNYLEVDNSFQKRYEGKLLSQNQVEEIQDDEID